jgi:molybdopterin-guanine dinucleotide biosynthesis protein A
VNTKSALILGGGKGSRIGYDKKKLAINGIPVLDSLIAKLSGLFPEVLLSSNNVPDFICGTDGIAAPPERRVTVVPDILGEGPLAGIYAGLCQCASDYLFVCACDMPFINADFIRYMDALIAGDAAAPKDLYIYRAPPQPGRKSAGFEPFNAFYRKTLIPSAKSALENREYKLASLIANASLHEITAQEAARYGTPAMFLNINRAEDLQHAEQLTRIPASTVLEPSYH